MIECITLAYGLLPYRLVSQVKLKNQDAPIDVTTLTGCTKGLWVHYIHVPVGYTYEFGEV